MAEAVRRCAHERLRRLRIRRIRNRARGALGSIQNARGDARLRRARAGSASARGVAGTSLALGESPSWLRQRILIPPCEGSNPSSPAIRFRDEGPGIRDWQHSEPRVRLIFCEQGWGRVPGPWTRAHGLRKPDGFHRERQPAARARGGEKGEHPARPRHGGQVLRRRDHGRAPGERARQGLLRAAVDLRACERQLDGSAPDRGCAEAGIDKRRPQPNVSEVMNVIGDVKGRNCVIMDDMVDTANTLVKAAHALKQEGAIRVVAYCTHPVLSGGAVERIAESEIDELVVTDSIPLSKAAQASKKIRVLSVAGLLAETILRISNEDSVSSLFIE